MHSLLKKDKKWTKNVCGQPTPPGHISTCNIKLSMSLNPSDLPISPALSHITVLLQEQHITSP